RVRQRPTTGGRGVAGEMSRLADVHRPDFALFFSSRRRHTRCYRDWSSDVCSSDLYHPQYARNTLQLNRGGRRFSEIGYLAGVFEIGRASCRERVWASAVAGAFTRKTRGRLASVTPHTCDMHSAGSLFWTASDSEAT